MSDLDFETRFAGQLRAYARLGVPPLDALVVAEATIASGGPRTRLRWPVIVGRHWPVPVVLGVLLVLALAGAVVVAGRLLDREPALPMVTVTERIAFVRDGFDQDASTDIWVMDSDGSDRTRLTDMPSPDEDPAWSPDSSRIAFTVGDAAAQVWLMSADGTDRRQLTHGADPASHPTWSPDGLSLVYDSGGALSVIRAGGGAPVRITEGPGTGDHLPVWSPRGDRIAFANGDGIYTVRPDGSARTLFARHVVEAADPPTTYAGLSWAPDGDRIAAAIDGSIWLEDGLSERELMGGRGTLFAGGVTWSPDGRRLAFSSYGGTSDTKGDILVINADGSGLVNILPGPSRDLSPAWAPR